MPPTVPATARVVIIGGGAVGCSLAYHLAELGWQDIVLLERKRLTSGTTWHAAGLIGQLRVSQNMTKLAQYSAAFFSRLQDKMGHPIGFKRHGSLSLAGDHERLEELHRGASMARVFGLEVRPVTPEEIGALYPLIDTQGVVGGVFLPGDGQLNPADVTHAMAQGARARGAKLIENVKVSAIHRRQDRVIGVSTDAGDIATDLVVNCAGMWGREIGRLAGVDVPLHACEHFYVVTEPIDGLPSDLPVLREPDHCLYYKEDAGKLLIGAFEPVAKPWGMSGIPEDFEFDELPEDMDHFAPLLESAMERLPVLANTGIRTFFNGPESFTPDNRYYLGPAAGLTGFFMACGFNSIGVQSSGGVGWALAEWLDKGQAPMDLVDVDPRRTFHFQNTAAYLHDRATEALGLLYAMHWPYRQPATARGVRHSPLHDRLAAAGACFGEAAGWERANWFDPDATTPPTYRYSYGRQNWFDLAAAEHRAVREGVALFDLSSFAKFRVEGPDAEALLQYVSANDVAVAPGRAVYTQWLNSAGGIEADLTITRLAEDSFMVVTGAAAATRDLDWLRRHTPAEARVAIVDVTAAEAVLAVMGPAARDLLQPLTAADLSAAAFPFGHAQEIDIGYVPVRAQRTSYVGELGFELYAPSEMAHGVFDRLRAAGADHGLRLAGYHVFDSCRIEKGFRHFGHDIGPDDTPLEAGLGFAVKFDKPASKFGPFIGRETLARQRDAGPLTKRLVQFRLNNPAPLLYHLEPILRDGEIVGYLTSGGYGHHLGGAVGLGYVNCPQGVDQDWLAGGHWQIEVALTAFDATASLAPLYDPKGQRMRA